ncbi:MAG: dihydrofolate reductase [Bacteriovoracaceae bacterium]|jgi:dihydrofolate reductase
MIVSLIVAIGKNRQIGKGNQMLWHIREDFKKFKETTMGHHLIMGRKTFESIGRPLPGRTTIIITTNSDYQAPEGVLIASSPEAALELARERGEDEAFVAGGGIIYDLFLEKANRLYLSRVDFDGEADVFFPKFDQYEWKSTLHEEFEATEKSPAWSFELLSK